MHFAYGPTLLPIPVFRDIEFEGVFIDRPIDATHHIPQRLLIYGTGQRRSDLEGGPVAGAPKVALDVGVGGGGGGVPGAQFNRNIFALSFGLKNGSRFHSDSKTCLN